MNYLFSIAPHLVIAKPTLLHKNVEAIAIALKREKDRQLSLLQ